MYFQHNNLRYEVYTVNKITMTIAQKYSQLLQQDIHNYYNDLCYIYTKILTKKPTKLPRLTRALTTLRRRPQYQWVSTVLHSTVLTITRTRTLVQSSALPTDTGPTTPAARLCVSFKRSAYIPRKTVSFGGGLDWPVGTRCTQVKLIKLLIIPQRYRGRIPS